MNGTRSAQFDGGFFLSLFCGLALFAVFLRMLSAWLDRGWHTLQRDFTNRDKPVGLTWLRVMTADVGATYYMNAMRVAIGEEGLHLRRTLPFAVFFSPLMIPWNAITHEWRDSEVLNLSVSTSRGPLKLSFHNPVASVIGESEGLVKRGTD